MHAGLGVLWGDWGDWVSSGGLEGSWASESDKVTGVARIARIMQADLGVLVQDSCEVIGSWVCLLGPWSIEGLWASKRVSEWQGHLELSWTAEIVFNIFLILLDMVGSKTDEIGDEPQIGATQVFPQKCQNKARGHSLKLQTVVGVQFWLSPGYGRERW